MKHFLLLSITLALLTTWNSGSVLRGRKRRRSPLPSKKYTMTVHSGVGSDTVDVNSAPGEIVQGTDQMTHYNDQIEVDKEEDKELEEEDDNGESEFPGNEFAEEYVSEHSNEDEMIPETVMEHETDELMRMKKANEQDSNEFPQDAESFVIKQTEIDELIHELHTALDGHETEEQITITNAAAVTLKIAMEGYKELRMKDQETSLGGEEEAEEFGFDDEDENLNEENHSEQDWDEESNADSDSFEVAHRDGEEEGETNLEHLEEELIEGHEDTSEHTEEDHDEKLEKVSEQIKEDQELSEEEQRENETDEQRMDREDAEEKERIRITIEGEVVITNDDIPDFLIVIEGLMKTYNKLFLNFPHEPSSSDSDEKNEEMERAYDRIVEFIGKVVKNRDTIQKEIEFLQKNLEAVKYSRDDVMNFYSFKHYWENLEHAARSSDEDWQQKKAILDLEVTEFVTSIKDILHSLTSIEAAQNLIWNETEFTREQMNSNTSHSVNEKVSGLPSLIQRLLNIKFDLDSELNSASLKLKNLSKQKRQFKECLSDMQVYLGINVSDYRDSVGLAVNRAWMLLLIAFFFKVEIE